MENRIEEENESQHKGNTKIALWVGIEPTQKSGTFNKCQRTLREAHKLHEGTNDSRIAKRVLFLSQLQYFTMKKGMIISQLHGKFKEILNRLCATKRVWKIITL